jgi:hypothetical protein
MLPHPWVPIIPLPGTGGAAGSPAPLGQAAVSSMWQPIFAAADSLMCLFARFAVASHDTIPATLIVNNEVIPPSEYSKRRYRR